MKLCHIITRCASFTSFREYNCRVRTVKIRLQDWCQEHLRSDSTSHCLQRRLYGNHQDAYRTPSKCWGAGWGRRDTSTSKSTKWFDHHSCFALLVLGKVPEWLIRWWSCFSNCFLIYCMYVCFCFICIKFYPIYINTIVSFDCSPLLILFIYVFVILIYFLF